MTDDLPTALAGEAASDAGPTPVVGAASDAIETATGPVDLDPADASLLALVDRLGAILDRSDLSEIAVEAGGTRLVLRKPSAVATVASASGPGPGNVTAGPVAAPTIGTPPGGPGESDAVPSRPSVKAPLTGIWYSSPAPGSESFVAVGREVAVGQVIGLIEAMKLFNEIKSDLAGRVVRVVPDSGALVKAKQPLIEVDPL